MTHPYRIVVGYDYSSTANLALHRAFEVAAREGLAEVHVVHVMLVGEFFAVGIETIPAPGLLAPIEDIREALEARVAAEMSAWQEKSHKTFSRLVTHVRYEYPAREIAQLATDLEAEMIVVGTHGRRGFNHFLMGSVAEGVLRLAECAVLVVKAVPLAQPEKAEPAILPPCPQCVEVRRETKGAEFWCEQHRERHGQRHTYHYESRVATPSNFPLVTR